MLVSLVILAAAALVWALAIGERLAITTAGALFVVVGYVLTNEFWQLSLGPVSLNAGRALLLGACLMFAVRVARGVIRVKAIEPLDLLIALFTGYLCLRFATTTPADVHASSVSPLWRLLACFIMPATLYFLVANDRLGPRHWKSALLLMTMLGGLPRIHRRGGDYHTVVGRLPQVHLRPHTRHPLRPRPRPGP